MWPLTPAGGWCRAWAWHAVSLAALYGLVALGSILAFAVSGVFNLALGAIFTIGAFQAFLAWVPGARWLGEDWFWLVPGFPRLSLLGGLLIAGVETAAAALNLSAWKEVPVFLLLILVLGLRPAGLAGRARTLASTRAWEVSRCNVSCRLQAAWLGSG